MRLRFFCHLRTCRLSFRKNIDQKSFKCANLQKPTAFFLFPLVSHHFKKVRDVHASFGSSQLRRVATQLEAMQRSEKVLRNVPGSAERTSTLTQLRSQLETLLRPQLLALLSKTPLCRAAELEPVLVILLLLLLLLRVLIMGKIAPASTEVNLTLHSFPKTF